MNHESNLSAPFVTDNLRLHPSLHSPFDSRETGREYALLSHGCQRCARFSSLKLPQLIISNHFRNDVLRQFSEMAKIVSSLGQIVHLAQHDETNNCRYVFLAMLIFVCFALRPFFLLRRRRLLRSLQIAWYTFLSVDSIINIVIVFLRSLSVSLCLFRRFPFCA